MSSTYANSFFGCLGVLCEHYGMTMPLTPEALRDSLAESEDLSAVESALVTPDSGSPVYRWRQRTCKALISRSPF